MSEPIGFPTLQEYRTALLNPKDAFVWPRLKGAIPQRSGLAFFWGQGRFAVAANVASDATSAAADAYAVTAVSSASAPAAAPQFGGASNGFGNIHVDSVTGEIYIYA